MALYKFCIVKFCIVIVAAADSECRIASKCHSHIFIASTDRCLDLVMRLSSHYSCNRHTVYSDERKQMPIPVVAAHTDDDETEPSDVEPSDEPELDSERQSES